MSPRRELAPDHRPEDEAERPDLRASGRLLSLQQAVGNQAVGRVLSRKAAATATGPTVQIGKLAIAVAGGNIDAWAAGEVPDALELTSQKGKHSAELEHMAQDSKPIKSLTLTVAAANPSGQELDMGSLAIEITNGHIKGYKADGDAESWQIAGFDGVHRTKTTHKVS